MASDRQSALLLAAGVISIACPFFCDTALGGPPPRFGCEPAAENTIDYKHGLSFERVDSDAIGSERPLPPPAAHFGPFDALRYGFQWVDIYVDTKRVVSPQWDRLDNPPMSMRIVAHMVGGRSDAWWRLRDQTKSDIQSSLYPPKWDVPSQVAHGDVPLLVFSWEDDPGDRGTCDFRYQLVLDFRSERPSIPAVIRCGECFQHGACTAADASFEPQTALDCAWDPPRADFLCTETTSYSGSRAGGSFERSLLLLSRTLLGFQTIHAGVPGSIAEMADWIAGKRVQVGKTVTVPRIGPVTAVASLSSGRDGDRHYLLATPATGCNVGFRFLLVTARASRDTVVKSIPSACLRDNLSLETLREEECDQFDPRGTRTSPTPTFAVGQIESGWNGVELLRVTVEDGSERWVYLIAVDESQQALRSESLRLATDAAEYTHCGNFRYPPQLVPTSIQFDPFQATVELEPAHFGNLIVPKEGDIEGGWFGEDTARVAPASTPAASVLLWTATGGFTLEPASTSPARQSGPRFVLIDRTGEISLHTPRGKPPGA